MPINSHDRFYAAESTPDSIRALGHALCLAFGQPADAFGSKGNLDHNYGYHRSRAWILHSPDSRFGSRDYSVRQPLDQGGADDDVCAADFSPAEWGSAKNRRLMAEITARVQAAALARDPRLDNWREFAGTLDGSSVVTFSCADGSALAPFDDSHLDHFHASAWRSRARNDHADLLAVITGVPASREDSMYLANVIGTDEVFLTNGLTARWVSATEFAHILALHSEGTAPLTNGGRVRGVAFQSLVGEVLGPRPERLGPAVETEVILAELAKATASWTKQLRNELAEEIADKVIAAPNNGLTEAERAALVAAVREVEA